MAALPEPEILDVEALCRAYVQGDIDLICVLGPTASGKTAFAVRLARQLSALAVTHTLSDLSVTHTLSDLSVMSSEVETSPSAALPRAEILSGDSRQVYRGMDIGTGKDLDEYQEIPYHLIDICEAGSRYTIYDYQRDFEAAYKDIRSRGRIPILCGGSGLYIEAATCGYHLPEVPPNPELRAQLETLDTVELRSRLLALRPSADASTLESRRRTIRALEVALYEEEHPAPRSAFLPKNVYYIGTLVSREDRVARIDRRLDARLQEGLVEEVRRLLASGVRAEDLMYYGLEYKFVTQHVLGILTYEEMRILLANAIHQFAKRQMTWFRGMERRGTTIHWVQP
ncbi:MAG: tRNA (adenosine(37)-N6)-dimethylallyltransferase MiaA [Bacteroidales bacterium]|nr:tRNA (adenosine(37)-N6)-dimethylallyltransferase MiaA [Bacteroidales bacterium]